MGDSSSGLNALWSRGHAPVPPGSLVAFRVLFGLLGSFGAARFLAYGWVDRFFAQPTHFFHYQGFEWVEPLSPMGMKAVFWVLVALGLMIAVGLFYRVAIVLFFLLFTYVELIDVTNYLNHYYLVSLLALWMSFMPLSSRASLDQRLRLPFRDGTLRRWMIVALRLQVAVVYLHAGLAKLTGDWLLHGQPMGIWMAARTDTPWIGSLVGEPWVALAMSWAGFLYDTTIPVWLSWRRTRVPAFLVLLTFHGFTHLLFTIGLFPLIMTCAATIFFDPSWPSRLVRGLSREPAEATRPPMRGWRAGLAAVGVAFALFQVVFPLRAHLYGGNVLWHEQGMRWSWRVLCREKAGSVTYRVRWAGRSRDALVYPSRYLTAHQEREMAGQPDLILQLAHHIADELRAEGRQDVEVRVDAIASLNGRAPVPLVDPEVDLATIRDSIAPASWITPEPSGPPLPLHPSDPPLRPTHR